jgi:hypothetical protein
MDDNDHQGDIHPHIPVLQCPSSGDLRGHDPDVFSTFTKRDPPET